MTAMKKLKLFATLAGLLVACAIDYAQAAGAPVNIAYPLNGSTVTNNFYSSFTVNCRAGVPSKAIWYLDGAMVGYTYFYDTAGVHFAYKLPSGGHTLKVTTSCGGSDGVAFKVL
jgi:hypothetical protein